MLEDHPLQGTFGIGHTRWATSRPTEENAHPHRDCTGRIVVVHNGIVENYLDLKQELTEQGHKFVTETDTEIIDAHLIEQVQKDAESKGTPIGSNRPCAVLSSASLALSLGILSSAEPDKIIAARSGPPVVIGVGEYFVASDIGILHHTQHLLSGRRRHGHPDQGRRRTDRLQRQALQRELTRISLDPIQAEKGGYKAHRRQRNLGAAACYPGHRSAAPPSPIRAASSSARWRSTTKAFTTASSINITLPAGTSWHSALAGKCADRTRLARLPVDVDYASEYRYRNPIPDRNALGLLITQSGDCRIRWPRSAK